MKLGCWQTVLPVGQIGGLAHLFSMNTVNAFPDPCAETGYSTAQTGLTSTNAPHDYGKEDQAHCSLFTGLLF